MCLAQSFLGRCLEKYNLALDALAMQLELERQASLFGLLPFRLLELLKSHDSPFTPVVIN